MSAPLLINLSKNERESYFCVDLPSEGTQFSMAKDDEYGVNQDLHTKYSIKSERDDFLRGGSLSECITSIAESDGECPRITEEDGSCDEFRSIDDVITLGTYRTPAPKDNLIDDLDFIEDLANVSVVSNDNISRRMEASEGTSAGNGTLEVTGGFKDNFENEIDAIYYEKDSEKFDASSLIAIIGSPKRSFKRDGSGLELAISFSVDEHDEIEEFCEKKERAAMMIQKRVRGYIQRKQYSKQKSISEGLHIWRRIQRLTHTLQRKNSFKRWKDKCHSKEKRYRALRQALLRGYKVRKIMSCLEMIALAGQVQEIEREIMRLSTNGIIKNTITGSVARQRRLKLQEFHCKYDYLFYTGKWAQSVRISRGLSYGRNSENLSTVTAFGNNTLNFEETTVMTKTPRRRVNLNTPYSRNSQNQRVARTEELEFNLSPVRCDDISTINCRDTISVGLESADIGGLSQGVGNRLRSKLPNNDFFTSSKTDLLTSEATVHDPLMEEPQRKSSKHRSKYASLENSRQDQRESSLTRTSVRNCNDLQSVPGNVQFSQERTPRVGVGMGLAFRSELEMNTPRSSTLGKRLQMNEIDDRISFKNLKSETYRAKPKGFDQETPIARTARTNHSRGKSSAPVATKVNLSILDSSTLSEAPATSKTSRSNSHRGTPSKRHNAKSLFKIPDHSGVTPRRGEPTFNPSNLIFKDTNSSTRNPVTTNNKRGRQQRQKFQESPNTSENSQSSPQFDDSLNLNSSQITSDGHSHLESDVNKLEAGLKKNLIKSLQIIQASRETSSTHRDLIAPDEHVAMVSRSMMVDRGDRLYCQGDEGDMKGKMVSPRKSRMNGILVRNRGMFSNHDALNTSLNIEQVKKSTFRQNVIASGGSNRQPATTRASQIGNRRFMYVDTQESQQKTQRTLKNPRGVLYR